MNRVALYARYSSDNQRDASFEDQLRLCRIYADRQGWAIVNSYSDRAVSGASLIRPGIQELLADALRGQFDIVLAEALDRISRDQEDVAGVFKRLSFANVKIVTLSEGEITPLHVGLKGTMNALFLKDLADKTRRGMRGRAELGKVPGGLSYGYRAVRRINDQGEPIRGERTIDPSEAALIRRIFQEFAAGRSPQAIAAQLNREHIPGPGGRPWFDGTIRGRRGSGKGILNNELYAGRLIWNRHRFIKDPASGKRVSRQNPESDWIRVEVPELRIVDYTLWQAVKARQAELGKLFESAIQGSRDARAARINQARRPAYLLSGLLVCGCCGGKYGIVVRDRYGCLNHHRHRTCDNARTIRRSVIEGRAIAGLKDKLVSPDAIAEAVRAYHDERNKLNRECRAQAGADRQALGRTDKAIKGIMAAIEDGLYRPEMKARFVELEQQKAAIAARLAATAPDLPDVNPNVAELYRCKVTNLADALSGPNPLPEISAQIRSLVGEIVLTPGPERGHLNALLRGELLGILAVARTQCEVAPLPSPAITKAAAGPCFRRDDEMVGFWSRNHLSVVRKSGERIALVALFEAEEFPGSDHVRRQRRYNAQDVALGMRNRDGAGVKVQFSGIGHAGRMRRGAAILAVAEDRRSDRRHMSPQLVCPAGDRIHRDPGQRLAGMRDGSIIGDGALAVILVFDDAFAGRARQFRQPPIDTSLPRLRQSDHGRPIDFPGRLVAKGAGEKPGRRHGAGQHQNAARVLVEPVDQPRPLRAAETQAVEHGVEMMLGRGAALDRKTRRLVEDDHIVVAVENCPLDFGDVAGFGLIVRLRRRYIRVGQRWNPHFLAGGDSVPGARAFAVDTDLPGAQQFLQTTMAELRKMPLEPAVQADFRILGQQLF